MNTSTPLVYSYTYEQSDRGSNFTTTKIETETVGDTTYKYTYDTYGNITEIQKVNADNTLTTLNTYIYDEYNQLYSVNDKATNTYTTYSYDESGNITRKIVKNLHPSYGYPTTTASDVSYTYGDSQWKDLLTTYNGQTITYDAIGNPLNYRDGITLTWQNGRELATFSNNSYDIEYTYDVSGMRTSKVINDSSEVNYVYENGLLLQMDFNGYIFDISYDVNGSPIGFRLDNGSYYYYGTNSRGDIIAIYNQSGTKLATYSYDAYGKFLGTTYILSNLTYNDNLAIDHNPLRYRGYVYDRETGFYYLQTRYYDPTTCRFINADGQLNTDSFTGYNMFAYCNNNPVLGYDPRGNFDLGNIIEFGTIIISGGFSFSFGVFSGTKTFFETGSITKAVNKTFTTTVSTFCTTNNIINTIYYNSISDGQSDIETNPRQSTYTEKYVSRWERLDYTKQETGELTYNENAWRFHSEYSLHMYGWYATGWALDKNIPYISDYAQRFKVADVHKIEWDSRIEVQIGTIIWGTLGL